MALVIFNIDDETLDFLLEEVLASTDPSAPLDTSLELALRDERLRRLHGHPRRAIAFDVPQFHGALLYRTAHRLALLILMLKEAGHEGAAEFYTTLHCEFVRQIIEQEGSRQPSSEAAAMSGRLLH